LAVRAAVDRLLAKFSKHKGIAKAMDLVADEYRKSKQYEKSRTIYQYIVDNWPDGERAMESQRGVAISNILLGDDAGAQAAIDKLIARFSGNEGIPGAPGSSIAAAVEVDLFRVLQYLFVYGLGR